MKLAFARGWLPAFLTFSDELPAGVGAMSLAFVVVVRPKYREDRGLVEHELELVAQWYAMAMATLILALVAWVQGQAGAAGGLVMASLGLQGFLYRRWPKFRFLCEAQAYGRQMQYPDRKGRHLPLAEAAARLSSERYDLGVSREEAAGKIAAGEKSSGGHSGLTRPH